MGSAESRFTRWAVPALLVSGCVASVLLFGLRRAAVVYRIGDVLPVPSGFTVDVRYVPSVSAPCHLIRIATDACPFSRQDRQQYLRLLAAARKRGCSVIAMAPVIGQMAIDPDPSVVQLQFVEMSLGRVLDVSMVPQTVLLNGSGAVVWQRQGAMNDRDVARARAALGSTR